MIRNLTARERRPYITQMADLNLWLFLAVIFTMVVPLVMQGLERAVE
jgi:hypothetical protein